MPLGRSRTRKLAELVEDATDTLRHEPQVAVDRIVAGDPEGGTELGDLLSLCQSLNRLADDEAAQASSKTTAATPEWEAAVGPLDDFHILREIGRGGMAVVYEAVQRTLGRRVALKVLPISMAVNIKNQRRFAHEAQAAAALDHPHIVPVYTVGMSHGFHYYAMRLISGQSLAQLIAHSRQESVGVRPCAWRSNRCRFRPPKLRFDNLSSVMKCVSGPDSSMVARLGVQVANALHYAHEAGVIHRDIKPSNLLISDTGHVWLTDFGLAFTTSVADLTDTGDVIGTLQYMSPEQAHGRPLAIDHRTDIYSLGLTLYEMLTLSPARQCADRQDLLRQISRYPPPSPRRINPNVPRPLSAIVVKAMAEKPEDRYATAGEMAEDLRRFLRHAPVKARRGVWVERVVKAYRRRSIMIRTTLWGIPVVTGTLILGSLVFQAQESARVASRHARSSQETADRRVFDVEQQMESIVENLAGLTSLWMACSPR